MTQTDLFWGHYSFINHWKNGDYGEVSLEHAINKHYKRHFVVKMTIMTPRKKEVSTSYVNLRGTLSDIEETFSSYAKGHGTLSDEDEQGDYYFNWVPEGLTEDAIITVPIATDILKKENYLKIYLDFYEGTGHIREDGKVFFHTDEYVDYADGYFEIPKQKLYNKMPKLKNPQ